MTWHDNGTVTFYQKKIWHFVPERSNGSLSDKVTNVNVIAAVSLRSLFVKARVIIIARYPSRQSLIQRDISTKR